MAASFMQHLGTRFTCLRDERSALFDRVRRLPDRIDHECMGADAELLGCICGTHLEFVGKFE